MGKRIQETDLKVGAAVRSRRMMLGMSQEKLAEACGVTFQQVQKYEKGTNRISASRLAQISSALGVAPAYFFPETEEAISSADKISELVKDASCVKLLQIYQSLDTHAREGLLSVATSMNAALAA